ncbi:uncharacterized protein LOC121766112 [Salvia splendens]|uniref:uncharacterized protein LOC121766112 n=1 Tax=Salvia splendens TaxID=180675 RepID=UPI001C25251C|nr:uncharacterized protein LOC121766112 [Salvia splendens]
MQGIDFLIDLHIIEIHGPNIVLGMEWLESLGKISADFVGKTLEFRRNGITLALHSVQPSPRLISLRSLAMLASHSSTHDFYEIIPVVTKNGETGTMSEEVFPSNTQSEVPLLSEERDQAESPRHARAGAYSAEPQPFLFSGPPYLEEGWHIQAAMNSIFQPLLRKCVIVFFDDILVYSPTLEEHCSHLAEVLQLLQSHQFFVKMSKCLLCDTTVEYLGHLVSDGVLKANPAKIVAMTAWPQPISVKQLRGFLGLMGYYRRSTKKEAFAWSPAAETAFADLKQAMTSAPVLSLPDFDKPFCIETDASDIGIGAVLIQDKHPIVYFSKKLGPGRRVASTYHKELYAIVEVVHKWRWDDSDDTTVAGDLATTAVPPTRADDFLPSEGRLSSRQSPNRHSTTASILHRRPGLFQVRILLSTHSKLKHPLLTEHHYTPIACHPDHERTFRLLSVGFYWPHMRKDVRKFVEACAVCQSTKYSTQKPAGLLQPLSIPSQVWEDVSMDFITGLPPSRGYTTIMVVVDRLSKYAHFAPLPTKFDALRVAHLFINTVVRHHGFPKTLVSDRDSVF